MRISNWTAGIFVVVAMVCSACQPVLPPTLVPNGTPLPSTPAPQPTSPPPEKILFVGNSFTVGIFEELEKMASLTDPPLVLEVKGSVIGGAILKTHWDAGRALEEVRNGEWDVVVLQDDIPEIREHDVQIFYEYVRRFDQEIKKADAQTVLYMTWEYRRLNWIDTDGIVAAHGNIAGELGARVAPVGLAWKRAMEQRPDLNLYDTDNEHPSVLGSFLTVNVLFATLFDRSPVGHTYNPAALIPDPDSEEDPRRKWLLQRLRDQYAISEEDAEFLQRIAWETVQEFQAQQRVSQ